MSAEGSIMTKPMKPDNFWENPGKLQQKSREIGEELKGRVLERIPKISVWQTGRSRKIDRYVEWSRRWQLEPGKPKSTYSLGAADIDP